MTRVINMVTLARDEDGMFVLPPNHVYIGRWNPSYRHTGPYRNDFIVGVHGTREYCLSAWQKQWAGYWLQPRNLAKLQRELRGKVLVCWCKPKDCHGDYLALLADSEPVDGL